MVQIRFAMAIVSDKTTKKHDFILNRNRIVGAPAHACSDCANCDPYLKWHMSK